VTFGDPAEFLTRRPPSQADPVETTSPPVINLTDPAPATARDAARTASTIRPGTLRPHPTAPGASQHEAPQLEAPQLDPADIDHLVFAVSEAVTNAHPRSPPGPVAPVDRGGPHRGHGHRPR